MKPIRYLSATIVFLVACPVSWVAAWHAGTWFTFALSLIMPTYGLIYYGLLEAIGPGFTQSLLSWVLSFAGAFVTLTLISSLLKDPASGASN